MKKLTLEDLARVHGVLMLVVCAMATVLAVWKDIPQLAPIILWALVMGVLLLVLSWYKSEREVQITGEVNLVARLTMFVGVGLLLAGGIGTGVAWRKGIPQLAIFICPAFMVGVSFIWWSVLEFRRGKRKS